jgi:hypothetical protein
MATSEGIIQFAFDLKPAGAHGPDRRQLAALAAWHGLLRQLQLIGQAPDRYGGYAYGNLSAREAEYKARFANPFVAGARGYIDDVIQPHETRRRICRSLAMLKDKRLDNPWRKHGNIPL